MIAEERNTSRFFQIVAATTVGLVIAMAGLEVARVMSLRHSVDDAVYRAARSAAVPGANAEEVRDVAQQHLRRSGVTHAVIEVSSLAATQREVTVRITVPLDSARLLPPQLVAGKSVHRELTLSREPM